MSCHECLNQVDTQNYSKAPFARERSLHVYIDFYNKCNLRCSMCNAHSRDESPTVLDRRTFEVLAEKVFPAARQLELSCSYEPLMFRGFFDYLEIASRYDIPIITVTTNAILLTRDAAERMANSGVTRIHVSVDGATRETYERIRSPARFDDLLENLAFFAARKRSNGSEDPGIQFQFVLMPENISEVSAFIDVFSVFSPYRFLFIHKNFCFPSVEIRDRIELALRNALDKCASRKIMFGEFPEFLISPDEVVSAYGGSAEVPRIGNACIDPGNFLAIRPNGDVFVCSDFRIPAGNLRQNDIVTILNGIHARQLREDVCRGSPPPACGECAYPHQGVVRVLRSFETTERILGELIGRAQVHR